MSVVPCDYQIVNELKFLWICLVSTQSDWTLSIDQPLFEAMTLKV